MRFPKRTKTQEAFARACRDVAEGLQRLEELLAERPFLCLGVFFRGSANFSSKNPSAGVEIESLKQMYLGRCDLMDSVDRFDMI